MTNGHNGHTEHGGAAVAEAHGGAAAHALSIDDLLEKATSEEVTRRGIDLHQDILDSRLSLLEEFYKKGLSGADKSAFEALTPLARIAKLRENNYQLKPELATQLVNYIGVEVLKAHSPEWGKLAEDAFNTLYRTDTSTPEQKIAARKNLLMARSMIENLGFSMGQMERIGSLRGFGPQIWQQFTQLIPQRFEDAHEEAHTYEITTEQAEKYLAEKVAPVTGIKPGEVIRQGIEEARSVMTAYVRSKRQNRLSDFKRQYLHYHGDAAPTPAPAAGDAHHGG